MQCLIKFAAPLDETLNIMQTSFVDVRAPTKWPFGLDFLPSMEAVHAHRGSTAQRAFAFSSQPRSRRDRTGLHGLQASNTPARQHPAIADPNLIEVSDIARSTAVRQSAREVNQSVLRTWHCSTEATATAEK
jgi:hypothetical protein